MTRGRQRLDGSLCAAFRQGTTTTRGETMTMRGEMAICDDDGVNNEPDDCGGWQRMTMKTTGVDNERRLAKSTIRDDDSDKFSYGDEADRVLYAIRA